MHRHSKHTPHTLQTHKNAHTLQTHKHAHTPNTQKRTQPPKSRVSPERKVAQGRGWYHWKGRTRIMGTPRGFRSLRPSYQKLFTKDMFVQVDKPLFTPIP